MVSEKLYLILEEKDEAPSFILKKMLNILQPYLGAKDAGVAFYALNDKTNFIGFDEHPKLQSKLIAGNLLAKPAPPKPFFLENIFPETIQENTTSKILALPLAKAKCSLFFLLEKPTEGKMRIPTSANQIMPVIKAVYRAANTEYRLDNLKRQEEILTQLHRITQNVTSIHILLPQILEYLRNVLDLETAFLLGDFDNINDMLFYQSGARILEDEAAQEKLRNIWSNPIFSQIRRKEETFYQFDRKTVIKLHDPSAVAIIEQLSFQQAYLLVLRKFKNQELVFVITTTGNNPVLSSRPRDFLIKIGKVINQAIERVYYLQKFNNSENNINSILGIFADQAIIKTDLKGKIVSLSNSVEALFGKEAAKYNQKHISMLLASENLNLDLLTDNKKLTNIIHIGEKRAPMDLKVTRLYDLDKPCGHLLFLKKHQPKQSKTIAKETEVIKAPDVMPLLDLSETKQFRESLLIRNLIESLDDIIWSLDDQGNIVFLNHSFEVKLGLEIDYYLNRNIKDILPVNIREKYLDAFRHIQKDGLTREFLTAMTDRDGSTSYYEITACPYRTGDKITGVYGWAHNITREKQLVREIFEKERDWRRLTENVNDIIYILDHSTNVKFLNSQWDNITGIPKSKVIGKRLEKYLDAPNKKILKENFKKVIKKRTSLKFKFKFKNKQGPGDLSLEAGASPMLDENGNVIGIWGVIRDITEQVHLTERLHRYTEDLERLVEVRTYSLQEFSRRLQQANSELEDFVYVVSHDLKAPLRAIAGFSQFLYEDYEDVLDKEGLEYLNRMMESTTHMATLINDLLEISKFNQVRVHYTNADLNKLFDKVLVLLAPSPDVTINIKNKLPSINVDETRMKQVFLNLLSNAIKFSPPTDTKIEITCTKKGEFYHFAIKDNGIGIDPKHHDRIFQMFHRLHTKDKYEGTGIGLGLVKKIVSEHKGNIWVESKLDEGSTFNFTIHEKLSDEDLPEKDLTIPTDTNYRI